AFWTDHVWVYAYDSVNNAFIHGADIAFDTTQMRDYTLSVRNQQYTLSAGGSPLLAGTLANYTGAGSPYNIPNFIFFGDDSSRGISTTRLANVSVLAPVPEP